MMAMRNSKFIVVLFFLAGITFSCQDFNEPRERIVDAKYYSYEINPNTIIDDIDHGQKVIFKPSPLDHENPVSVEKEWKQEDFFKVIDTWTNARLSESFLLYRLDLLSADYKCKEIGKNPWRIFARYYLESKSGDIDQRERILFVAMPEYGFFSVDYTKWQPLLSNKVTANRQDIKIPFEEAIQIANENGGQTFIDNHPEYCKVSIDLFPKRGNKLVWELRYQGPEIYEYIEVKVDAVTGKAHMKNFIDYLFDL